MNGEALSITKRWMPRAIRLSVFSASGFLRSNMLGAGIDQSMHSAAVRHGASLPASTAGDFGSPWVASGQTIGCPSRRITMKKRFRMVGAP
jgi:hypothetical protein